MVSETCQYAADNREFDEGEPEKVVVVDGGYLDMNAPIARERIAMGGVRLAGLLNRALGHQSARLAELLGRTLAIPRGAGFVASVGGTAATKRPHRTFTYLDQTIRRAQFNPLSNTSKQ